MIKPKHILIFLLLFTAHSARSQDVVKVGPAGTKLVLQADKKIFPCKWNKKHINPEFIQLEQSEIERTIAVMVVSLDKYPPALLKRNLKSVYVLKNMFFFGLEFGGTYYKRKVYLANNGLEKGYSDAYLEGSFHHEFSSVLLKRHYRKFDHEAWSNANPEGFTYGDGGVAALRTNQTGLELDSALFRQGFLNEYSLAAKEEDFNCYAEYIFRNDPGFWHAWESSEAIRIKAEILIRFYQRIDPTFTLEYFRSL